MFDTLPSRATFSFLRMVKATTRLILLTCCLPAFAQESTNFVFFPKQQLAVNEAVPVFQVPVQRLGDTNTTLSVEYSVTPGDGAEPDTDFVATQGTLTFAAGETNKFIAISILDDQIPEPRKFINIALTNLTGDAILTNDTATLTLIDNDGRANTIDASFGFELTNVAAVNDVLVSPENLIWFASDPTGIYGSGIGIGVVDQHGSNGAAIYASFADPFYSLGLTPEQSITRGGSDRYLGPVQTGSDAFGDFRFFVNHQHLKGVARKVLVGSNGRTIAAGAFTISSGTNIFGLVALDRTGSIDSSFDSSTSTNLSVEVAAFSGNKILAGYIRTNDDRSVVHNLGRWNLDGSPDTAFVPTVLGDLSPSARITAIEPEPDLGALVLSVEYENGSGETFSR
jgi:hypothetical protein